MRVPESTLFFGGVHPVGESQIQPLQLSFHRFLRVAFQGSRVISKGGLILVRELDERPGFGELIEQYRSDWRAINARFCLADLLRQSVYSRLAGEEEKLGGLARLNPELLGTAEALDSPCRTVLDMDSTEIPVYGEQEQSAYNGHFESTCYHPLLLFNREGDCLAAK